jgi:drug/metabolite transporter (DMT)-like permease
MSIYGAIGLVILGTLIGSWGALLFKMSAEKFSLNPVKLLTNWKLMLGGCFYLVSTVPFLIAVKYGELCVLYPFVSLSYVWVVFLSVLFLKEKMNVWKWLGICFIIAGVSFIGIGKSL